MPEQFDLIYRPASGDGCGGEKCGSDSARSKRTARVLLWAATLFPLATTLGPWAAAYRADRAAAICSPSPTFAQLGVSAMETTAGGTEQQSSNSRNSLPLITLKDGVRPLHDAFNREVAKTRLVLLVSPT